jgi:P-type E1-E2 ATPase
VRESPGQGVDGEVEGRRVVVGGAAFVTAHGVRADARTREPGGAGEAHVLVAVDGKLAGVLVLADRLRPDAEGLIQRLRAAGVRHVAMASGDRREVAETLGAEVGVDAVYAELGPDDKLEVVRRIHADPALRPVVMVGDGINDAPALAVADVGIALGAGGATVASQTADAVIVVDRVDRVADAIELSGRAMHIARQSVIAGIALSVAGMVVAAAGYLPPVAGALFQEAIDVAVILNALRALRD